MTGQECFQLGDRFADAANKYSQVPANKETPNGGDLGCFPRRGQFIESFVASKRTHGSILTVT